MSDIATIVLPEFTAVPGDFTTAQYNSLRSDVDDILDGSASLAAINVTGDTNLGNSSSDTTTITGHLDTAGSAPTIAAGASAGAGATASILRGNDTSGQLQINMGTGAGTGIIATITFNTPRPDANYQVFLMPADSDAADLSGKVHCLDSDRSTTSWKIRVVVAPTSSASHVFDYLVVG